MRNVHRFLMMAMVVVSLLVAGCTAGGEEIYSYDSSQGMAAGGSNLDDVHDTFESPGKARIAFSIGGSGRADVSITDADGAQIYTRTIQSGGAADAKRLSGASGTWTIDIDFTNWNGGFALSITEA